MKSVRISMPKLSIIVIFYNMRREASRTLLSLSAGYQKGVSEDDYEVIAIDNGSNTPLEAEDVTGFGGNFRYLYHKTTSVSPAEAMNIGAGLAQADNLAFIVDGARLASPGLLATSLKALTQMPNPFVAALAWHLGPDVQNRSMLQGYDQAAEDKLFERINWPNSNYRLFNISTLAQSSQPGFLGGMPPECSWLTLPRTIFDILGGYDERFQSGGGGLVNHDFRNRAMTTPNIQPITLLGEGLFHQIHGGVATNVDLKDHPIDLFKAEYQEIRGQAYKPAPCPVVTYLGTMPQSAFRFIRQ